MGEHSKEVGELGEKIAREFFTRLGWTDGVWNRDINCSRPQAHESSTSKHGLDAFYIQTPTLFKDRSTAVFVSVKCNEGKYPSGRTTKYRQYREQLEKTIYCAMRDKELIEQHPQLATVTDVIGIVMWISTKGDGEIIREVTSSRHKLTRQSKISILIDDKRRSFIDRSIQQVSHWASVNKFEWTFHYPSVDFNTALVADKNCGTFLPVYMLHSTILYFVCTDASNNKSLLVFVDETPDLEGLISYIGSVLHWTNALQSHTQFAFRGLNVDANRKLIETAKSTLRVSDGQVSVKQFVGL